MGRLHTNDKIKNANVINMTKCKNNSCEYSPTINRQLTHKRKLAEIRYAQLWAEIELPKLLKTKPHGERLNTA
jgi:hypothetical protein